MSLPTMTYRIAFATAPFAATPTWTTLNERDVQELSVKRGRQYYLGRMESGQGSMVLDNSSGNFWPDNSSGPYYGNIFPGKKVNVRATYNSITYDVFTGYLDAWTPGFRSIGGKGPVINVRAMDVQSDLSRYLLNNAGEAQELSGTRVGNVLDEISFPAADRDLDAGQSNVIATGAQANVNPLEHLFLVQETEMGIMFHRGDGYVEFQDRHARLKSPLNTSQATFSDTPGNQKYIDLVMDMDIKDVLNDVRITRSGGTEQTASDSTSQTAYKKRSLSRTGLLMTADAEALTQARYILSLYKDAKMRCKAIVIRPQGDPTNLWPKVLGYDLSTMITLQLDPSGIDRDFHIEGITHDVDLLRGTWQTTWDLSDADPQRYWTLGVAGYSEIGETTRLAY